MFHNRGLIIKRWIIQDHRGHIPGIAQGAGLHPKISEKIKRPPIARSANRRSQNRICSCVADVTVFSNLFYRISLTFVYGFYSNNSYKIEEI